MEVPSEGLVPSGWMARFSGKMSMATTASLSAHFWATVTTVRL